MNEDFVVNALRLVGRPLGQAELVALRFGSAPTDAERKQIANAVRSLQGSGRVTSTLDAVRNARGAQRQQRVVELVAMNVPAELAAPATEASDTAPDAVALHDESGELIGWDESAAHAYLAERGQLSRCDDECASRGHIEPW